MPSTEGRPLRLFISASPEDRELKDQLLRHLQVLVRFAGIDVWNADQVRAGEDWRRWVDQALDRAEVVLLLISADFLASDFLQDVEVAKLFERHAKGGVQVIPVLLRSCLWEMHPWLSKLAPLPTDRKPIASLQGDGRDSAFAEVARDIATATLPQYRPPEQMVVTSVAEPVQPFPYAASPNVQSPPSVIWSITLDVQLESLDHAHRDEIVEHLRELTGDPSVQLERIRRGSVVLILRGTRDGYKILEFLYKSGQLKEVLGIPVLGVNWSERGDDESSPQGRTQADSTSFEATDAAVASAGEPTAHSPANVAVAARGAIDFAILTAIRVEREAVCTAFGLSDKDRVKKDGRVYWRGQLELSEGKNYQLVVAQLVETGNVEAALLAADAIRHWSPSVALLVGVAASADPDRVKLGDVVVGKSVWYYEHGKVTEQDVKPQPEMIPADFKLLNHIIGLPNWEGKMVVKRPDRKRGPPRIHEGVIASGEKVIAHEAVRDQIASAHRKILAIEMDGYGFSRAIWQSCDHVRHLDIRGICDDGSAAKDDRWHAYAAAAVAGFTRHLLLDSPLESSSQFDTSFDPEGETPLRSLPHGLAAWDRMGAPKKPGQPALSRTWLQGDLV
jgi:nucleoside phosphorylase